MTFTCQVCFEQKDKRLPLTKLATGNGDVLRTDDCEHPICQECLATFVTTRVQEQFAFNLRCPYVGCANEIFEQDVTRLVAASVLPASISLRFAELRTRDYTARAEALSQTLTELEEGDDLDLLQKIWETTRLCPRCSLAIERSQGCNSFYCICGHHFDYARAPRIFGNHVENYGKVIEFAKQLSLSLAESERYGSNTEALGKKWTSARASAVHHAVRRTAKTAKMEMDDAWQLHQKAKSGDKDAQKCIHRVLGREEREFQIEGEEQEEGWTPCLFLWNNSTSHTQNSDDVHKEVGTGTHITLVAPVAWIVEEQCINSTSDNNLEGDLMFLQAVSPLDAFMSQAFVACSKKKPSSSLSVKVSVDLQGSCPDKESS